MLDHSGIEVCLTDRRHSRPKPFWFFNCWADHELYRELVRKTWEAEVDLVPMFRISQKLKKLKNELKKFNREVFLPELRASLELEEKLREVQSRLMDRGPQGRLEEEEVELYKKVYKAKLMEEDAKRQKSRVLWLDKGDSNTAFFHRKAKSRKGWNTIERLQNSNGTGLKRRVR